MNYSKNKDIRSLSSNWLYILQDSYFYKLNYLVVSFISSLKSKGKKGNKKKSIFENKFIFIIRRIYALILSFFL